MFFIKGDFHCGYKFTRVLGISQNLRTIKSMRLNYSFSTAHVSEFSFIQKKDWKLMPLKQILVPRSLPLHHFYSSIGVICQIDWLWLKGHLMWNLKDHLTNLFRNGWNLVCRFSQSAEQLYQILHYLDKYFLRYWTMKIADQKSFLLNVMLSNILRDTKIGKYVWTHKRWWAENLHSDRFCTGVGGMVLILAGSPDNALAFFISKTIVLQYRFLAKKGSSSVFG